MDALRRSRDVFTRHQGLRRTTATFARAWRSCLPLALGIAAILGNGYCVDRAAAQVPGAMQPVPTVTYLSTYGLYYQGEYDNALRDYLNEGRTAIKTVESNWIDSICYHAMAGECYFQMGQLAKAQVHFDSALQLYVAFSDWMIRVTFTPTINPAGPGQVVACPWGQSQRAARWGQFPDVSSIAQGRVNNNAAVQGGGVVQQAQLFPIRPIEIVKATALAIRRRHEMLGPLGEHDTLTKDVVASLTRRPTQPNHWSEAWIDVQLGLAFSAANKPDQAKPVLERAVLAAGEFNHPLTGVVLLELGKIALTEGNFDAAARYLEEATYAAFEYQDANVLEEAFRFGTLVHIVSNQQGVYPPLVNAANWARVQGYRQLQASLNLMMAESLAIAGDQQQASTLIATARGLMANRAMLRGKIGARLNFLSALTLYQEGSMVDGDNLLSTVLAFQRNASPWMYQIDITDAQLVQGTLAPRTAGTIYQQLLREPTSADWLFDPLEALTVISLPHPQSYEHWYELAIGRRELIAALDISDEAHRHRFLATMPLGGRPLGLRWILESPVDALSPAAKLERQDLLGRYPQYDQLSQQTRQVQAELSKLPLVAEDPESRKAQSGALTRLAELSYGQEQLLRVMSVRRNPGSLYFPSRRTSKEIQDSLAPGQAVLAFVATSRHYYGFLISNDNFNSWEINAPAAVHRKVGHLLREMNLLDGNRELPFDQLKSEKWKKPARELWTTLTDSSKTNLFDGLKELIIVPDGSLWYVPFAALQVGHDGKSEPLVSKVRLRMAPLVSMTLPGSRGRAIQSSTAVVLGKLSGRDDAEVAQIAFDEFSKAVPGSVALSGSIPAPSALYASLMRRLVVFDDLKGTADGSLSWSPIQLDQTGDARSLATWLELPFPAPNEVLLPGFHTAAENALKQSSVESAGDEIFRSVCGLMACGAQTVLLSQWRTGGQTSYDLIREFAQELPHSSASESWQRAVELVMAEKVDPEREPRVKKNAKQELSSAAHPFFWAGYLLVDTGATVDGPEQPPAQAAPAAANPPVGQAPPAAAAPKAIPPGAAGQPAAVPMGPDAEILAPPDAPFADGDEEMVEPVKPRAKKPAKTKPPKTPKQKPSKKPATPK